MASAGPVHRNFGGGRSAPSSSQRSKNGITARAFFFALVALVVVLLGTALHLSRRVMDQAASAADALDGRRSTRGSGVGRSAVAVAPGAGAGKDRVYCMVPFIWNEVIYSAIMDTWGKRCDVINFLTDAVVGGQLQGDKISDKDGVGYKPYWEWTDMEFPDNVVFINMTRTWNDCPEEKGVKKVCRHIWEKMWRSWVYVDEHHLDQAEWFCKVDYDTFFFPQNVKYFVREQHNWDPYTEHHYFGHLINHRQEGREPMIVGAAACWSRKTLHEIAEVYRNMPKGSTKGERNKCEDRAQATEEASTSLCLKRNLNVSAYPARDPELREYIAVSKYKDVLTWNRTKQGEWWYWKGKPEGAGEMENTIARRPIGLHKFKNENEIREIDRHFYGPPDNSYIKKMKPYQKAFVMEVRKAIGTDPWRESLGDASWSGI